MYIYIYIYIYIYTCVYIYIYTHTFVVVVVDIAVDFDFHFVVVVVVVGGGRWFCCVFPLTARLYKGSCTSRKTSSQTPPQKSRTSVLPQTLVCHRV